MSFMSFDYAMRAADAALQFQQQQGQNIKDTGARAREVGTGNAKRKDDLVRQKIEAEYGARSADIKKEKAARLMAIAEERKNSAQLAAALVGIGTLAGGILDGIKDLASAKKDQMPEQDQVTLSDEDMSVSTYGGEVGNVAAFKIAAGNGNSEQGAMVAYDPKKANFSIVGVDTASGRVSGFVNLSRTDMARHILSRIGDEAGNENNQALRSLMEEGPPPMFKASAFKKDADGKPTNEFTDEAQRLLMGPQGFFMQSSGPNPTGSDAGEKLVGDLLSNPAAISTSYEATASSVMRMLENPGIQDNLGMDNKAVDNARTAFKDAGVLKSGLSKMGDGANKLLFKPLGTALPQFMEMAKVMKEYDEEYKEKVAEYEAAKKQAAAAKKKLQELEALLAAGSSS